MHKVLGNSTTNLSIPIDLDNPQVLNQFLTQFLNQLPQIVESEVNRALASGGRVIVNNNDSSSNDCEDISELHATYLQLQSDLKHRLKDDGSIISFKPQQYKTDLTFTDDKQMVSKKYVDDNTDNANLLHKDGSVLSEAIQQYSSMANLNFHNDEDIVSKQYVDMIAYNSASIPKTGWDLIAGNLRYDVTPTDRSKQLIPNLGIINTLFENIQRNYEAADFQNNSQVFTSDDTFTVPADVYRLLVMMCGGGDAGARLDHTAPPEDYYWRLRGGSGAGMYASVIDVTPGDNLDVVIGQGGTAANREGGATRVGNLITQGRNEATKGFWVYFIVHSDGSADTVDEYEVGQPTEYIIQKTENSGGTWGSFTAKTVSSFDDTIDANTNTRAGIAGGVGGVWDFIDDTVYSGQGGTCDPTGSTNATGYGCGGADFYTDGAVSGEGEGSPGIAVIRW